jgi:menaquinone-dependent protoporphyrinogen oxidase
MRARILVTYATAAGSTTGVATALREQLARRGHESVCCSVDRSPGPGNFDAVVVGSAVHGQAWLVSALEWLHVNRQTLRAEPVWAFSVGMPAAVGRPFRRLALLEGPKIAAALRRELPLRDHRLFSGVVARDTFAGPSRWAFRLMGCRYGDFRDWPAITKYAEDIADELDASA